MENSEIAVKLANYKLGPPSDSKIYAERIFDTIISTERHPNRQQEVMGHLVNAIENPEFNKQVHTYNLYKEQDFFGYGIACHTEDISISKPEHRLVYPLIEIEDNSPAAKSGMKNYQRVVAVNGEFVNKDFRTLEDVVQSIEDSYYSRDFTEISVIDSQLWETLMENPEIAVKLANYKLSSPSDSRILPKLNNNKAEEQIADDLQADSELLKPINSSIIKKPQPRLISLRKKTETLGFGLFYDNNIVAFSKEFKIFRVCEIVKNSWAASAGFLNGDYLLEVSGKRTCLFKTKDELFDWIQMKRSENSVDFLLADPLTLYKLQNESNYSDYSLFDENLPKLYKFDVPDFRSELGFSLKFTIQPYDKQLECYLHDVLPDSVTYSMGLREGDHIIEISGENVFNWTLEEISNFTLEKKKKNNLQILVTNFETYRIIKKSFNKLNSSVQSENFNTLTYKKESVTRAFSEIQTSNLASSLSKSISDLPSAADLGDLRMTGRFENDRSRAESIEVTQDGRKTRPKSISDIDRINRDTVRSNMSMADLCKPKFKSCNVVLLPDFQGYGFTLNSKIKPKYTIYTIDPNSPAYKANLRDSDVIVQIDKKNIRRQKFDKIKQMLSDSQKKGGVEILAIDREGYMYYKNRKKRFSSNKLVTVENTEHFWTEMSATGGQPKTD